MADTPYPIPRQLRESAKLVGNGGVLYSGFTFKIFDVTDVEVWLKRAADLKFSPTSVVVQKINGQPFDNFSITFPQAVTAADKFLVLSRRVPARSAGVRSGTKIDPDALEREFSKIATTEQELRRDIGRAIAPAPGEDLQVLPTPDGTSLLGWDAQGKLVNRATEGMSSAAAEAAAALALAAAAGVNLPPVAAKRFLVDNAAGTARESKTFQQVRDLLLKEGSGQHWEHNGAVILRMRDRLFLGNAVTDDGNEPDGGGPWPNSLRQASVAASQFASISTIGHTAVFGGSRTSDNGVDGSAGTIGGYHIALNNNDVLHQAAYGLYTEAWRYAGTGATFAHELDIINFGETADLFPHIMLDAAEQLTVGLWVASGGEVGTTPASLAIGIVRNGQPFRKGILFGKDSLQTDIAIGMPSSYGIYWFVPNSGAAARVDFGQETLYFNDVGAFVGSIGNDANMLTLTLGSGGLRYNGLPVISGPGGGGALLGYTQENLDGTYVRRPYYAVP